MGMISVEQVRSRITNSIPPFPAIAQKLLAVTASPDCSARQVAELVRTDAAFAGEVLRLANSSVLSLRFGVMNILQAVSLLGMRRVNSLVLTVAMRGFVAGARQNEMLRLAWRHNFAAALAADWMAEPCGIDRAAAYSAGLLHEIGRLAMVAEFGNRYMLLVERAARTACDLEALERNFVGINASEAGELLAAHWRLPDPLRAAVLMQRPAPGTQFGLAHLTSVACEISEKLGFAFAGSAAEWDPAVIEANLPPYAVRQLQGGLDELREGLPLKIKLFESSFLS